MATSARRVILWPPLLTRLDTFYELALGNQSLGYRGSTVDQLDIATNSVEIMRWLNGLFESANGPVLKLKGKAYGNAHLALAMLHDQAGNWAAARHHMWRALRHNPPLLTLPFLRRLLKLHLGRPIVRHITSAIRKSNRENLLGVL